MYLGRFIITDNNCISLKTIKLYDFLLYQLQVKFSIYLDNFVE